MSHSSSNQCGVRTLGLLGLILLGLSMLPSCGNSHAAPVDPEQALRDRVTGFWDTRIRMHDLYEDEAAYNALLAEQFDYWDPDFKKQMRLTAYQASRGSAIYEKAEVVKVEVDGDVGWVHVKYDWRIANPPAGLTSESTLTTSDIKDSEWMLVDGVWYKKFDMKKAFGGGSRRRQRASAASTEDEQE